MIRNTRPISWVKAALKDFLEFPEEAQLEIRRALTVAAEGAKAENAKPLKGLGAGVFEIALKYKTNAYRVIANWGSNLGNSCLSEKIKDRNQDPKKRNRPD